MVAARLSCCFRQLDVYLHTDYNYHAMSLDYEQIRAVAAQTKILRPPQQKLATFGVTSIYYYLITEPAYAELAGGEGGEAETVIREGRLTAERPQIITPFYLLHLFQGFPHGQEYAQFLLNAYGAQAPGLMYSYRNDLKDTNVVSDPLPVVADRLKEKLAKEGEALSAIVRGVDHLWDVSLMKFIHDLTASSLGHNVAELSQQRLFDVERGAPRAAHLRIEELFRAVQAGEVEPKVLKAELDRWGLFAAYEDRFLGLFRRR